MSSRGLSPSFTVLTLTMILTVTGPGCAGKKPKRQEPEIRLSELNGKRVAIIDIHGSPTAKKVVEVALVNQILKRGTFQLVSKQDVEKAREHFQIDPRNTIGIAKKAGAEFALRIQVDEFSAETYRGHSKERVYDSQMAQERGEDEGEVDRLYEVRTIHGKVRLNLVFTNVQTSHIVGGHAEASKKTVRDSRKGAIHLPPKLRFLEKLTQDALESFFIEHS